MDLKKHLDKLQEQVLDSILDYMSYFEDDEEPEFTKDDVARCEALLKDFLVALSELKEPDDAAIMAEVEKVVLALNALNEELDYALIETEERENIWDLIQCAAVDCGLQEVYDDVTEEWREW